MKKPNFDIEKSLWRRNIQYVIGIDEVGRGAFAGPIVAGAVVFPQIKRIGKKFTFLKKVNDSKSVKAPLRRKLAKLIKKHSLFWSVSEVGTEIINKHGIGKANHLVIRQVAKKISSQFHNKSFYIICDGLQVQDLEKHKSIIDGDCKSLSIAAASIIAKVHRDSLMRNYSRKYHYYKFSRNKGYGTKGHQAALKKYGLTEIHRTSFELSKFLSQ